MKHLESRVFLNCMVIQNYRITCSRRRCASPRIAVLKDRVRNFIAGDHWLTDGEWKESVLRSMIKRSISQSFAVGIGFIVKKEVSSGQIDILIYDSSRPVLYQDDDLVFIPPISCRGIIEVKSNVKKNALKGILTKLANKSQFVLDTEPKLDLFVGLFSYDTNYAEGDSNKILNALQKSADENSKRIVNHVCLGKSIFAKYWKKNPINGHVKDYKSWHTYKLKDKAIGYFLHNLMSHAANKKLIGNENVWFPEDGKEANGKESRKLGDITLLKNV